MQMKHSHLYTRLMKRLFVFMLCVLSLTLAKSQEPSLRQQERAKEEERTWRPTGVWPFLNQRFLPAEVVTGMFTKKKTQVVANIHVANHSLWYVQNDTTLEADGSNINIVRFKNGDVYIPLDNKTLGKVIIDDDSIGKVVMVRSIDPVKFEEQGRDASQMGTFSLSGDFGNIDLDLTSQYDGKPEEKPLPILDTYYFIYNREIFEVTDKNILPRINPKRRKEYRAFTRSAEILVHQESSVRKIWNTFFHHR